MQTKDLISIAIITCVIFSICETESARQANKIKQSTTCGVPQVILGDVRTISPWSAAVFTQSSSGKGALRFFTNGVIVGPTTILSVAGGPYGVTLRGAKNSNYSIPSADIFHVYAGINTTNFEAHDQFAQTSRVVFVEPLRDNQFQNEHYHIFLYHLQTPLDFSTPYVKEICLPLVLKNLSKNQSPYGWQLIQGGFAQGPGPSTPLTLKAWKVTTGPKKICESAFRYHYKREIGGPTFCGRRDVNKTVNTAPYATIVHSVDKGENDNDLCHLHGSSLSFEIGKVWYVASFVILIPGRRRGRCSHKSFYVFGDVLGNLARLSKSQSCSPNRFACGDSECIPISSVCNGIPDCKDESDEDEIFCEAQNPCGSKKTLQTHSCGLRGGCIEKNLVCNKTPDCDNKSDEYPPMCQGNSTTRTTVRKIGSRRRSCPPVNPFESTIITCFDTLTNKQVDCASANYEGARVTLTCDEYHKPHYSYDTVVMTCSPDGEWVGRQPFSCDQECGVIREGQIEGYTGLPWHAVIYSNVKNQQSQICSAVLIERKFLLTAAYCVSIWLTDRIQNRDLLTVILNPISPKLPVNLQSKFLHVSPVKQIWISPNSKTTTGTDNLTGAIAMIELQNPTVIDTKNHPTPACYAVPPFRVPSPGKIGIVTGFDIGGSDETSTSTESLKIGNVTVVDREECQGFGFCGEFNDGSSLCNGDIGGGIFFLEKTGDRMAHVLKGIVTPLSLKDCSDAKFSSFTSIVQYTDWMLDILESYS